MKFELSRPLASINLEQSRLNPESVATLPTLGLWLHPLSNFYIFATIALTRPILLFLAQSQIFCTRKYSR